MTSRNKSGIAQQRNDFGQDDFDAPSQLGFQRHILAKFTANEELIQDTTASKRRTVQDEGHTHQWPLLGVVKMHVHLLSCGVLLPARRGLTGKGHVVCEPNFGSQLWKRNGYICVYFYWPPGPNPVVTISTRVGPGSRLNIKLPFGRPPALCGRPNGHFVPYFSTRCPG